MKKIVLIALSVAGFLAFSFSNTEANEPEEVQNLNNHNAHKKPNIVFVLADDLTFRDIGCYGSNDAITPNIDQLAAEGMKFTNSHQAAPMCSPTRQNLLTGLYPVRSGAYPNHTFVKEGTKSIVHYLKDLGYNVGLQGKRHISPKEAFPFDYLGKQRNDVDTSLINPFIDKSIEADKPFTLFAMSHSPHRPWNKGNVSLFDPNEVELPPYYVDNQETREQFVKYLAEITFLDNEVGRVIESLKDRGIYDNTLFIFSSEQGNALPFAKFTLYTAGLKNAFIARWPGHIEKGSSTSAMVEYVDVTPTLVEVAGGEPDTSLDGRSFLPVMLGEKEEHKEYTYGIQTTRGINNGSKYFGIRSIFDGRYRYIWNLFPEIKFSCTITSDNNRTFNSWIEDSSSNAFAKQQVERYQWRPYEELYDTKNDKYEMNNLACDPEYKDVKLKLRRKLLEWMKVQGDKGRQTEKEAKEHQ